MLCRRVAPTFGKRAVFVACMHTHETCKFVQKSLQIIELLMEPISLVLASMPDACSSPFSLYPLVSPCIPVVTPCIPVVIPTFLFPAKTGDGGQRPPVLPPGRLSVPCQATLPRGPLPRGLRGVLQGVEGSVMCRGVLQGVEGNVMCRVVLQGVEGGAEEYSRKSRSVKMS